MCTGVGGLMGRREERYSMGKIEGRRRRVQQRMRCLDDITNAMDMNLSTFQELAMDREA